MTDNAPSAPNSLIPSVGTNTLIEMCKPAMLASTKAAQTGSIVCGDRSEMVGVIEHFIYLEGKVLGHSTSNQFVNQVVTTGIWRVAFLKDQ